MIRFCPNCQSERSLSEIFCEGSIQGQPCGWDLSAEAIHPAGWRPQPVLTQEAIAPPASEPPAASAPLCANGHPLQPGDLMCLSAAPRRPKARCRCRPRPRRSPPSRKP